jgi:hypothetical protein
MIVQLPVVLTVVGRLRLGLMTGSAHVREIVRNFGRCSWGAESFRSVPTSMRGLRRCLIAGSVAALTYAQNLRRCR